MSLLDINKVQYDHKDIWDEIVDEYESKRQECENFIKDCHPKIKYPNDIINQTEWGYMDQKVFPILIPTINSMLFKAKKWNAIKFNRTSRFNGLDHLAELLWNFNPKHPDRYKNYLDIYDIPFVLDYLKKHPRPIFLRSEIYSLNFAAILIQSYYRGYLVRRRKDVQELKQFWKDYKEDQTNKQLLTTESKQHSIGIEDPLKQECDCECDKVSAVSAEHEKQEPELTAMDTPYFEYDYLNQENTSFYSSEGSSKQ